MANSPSVGPSPKPTPSPQGFPGAVPRPEPATELMARPGAAPQPGPTTQRNVKPAQPQPGSQPPPAQEDGPATELIRESATEAEDEATTERLPELPRQPEPSVTERFPDLYRQPTSAASYSTPTLPDPAPPPPGYSPPYAPQPQAYAPGPPQGYSPQPPGYGPPQPPMPGYGPPQPQGYAPIPPQGYGPQPGYGPYDPAYGYAPYGQPPYGYAPPQAAPSPAADPQPAEEPRPKSGVTAFWGIIAWRLLLTVLAAIPLFSLLEAASRPWELLNQLLYFTLLTDIVILLVNGYGVFRPLLLFWAAPHLRTEGRTAWVRGLATTMGVFTAVVYATMLGGDYSGVSVIPHLILPVAMVIDWLFIGRAQGNNGPSAPITWVLLLAPYVGIYYWDATVDRPMYPFLNPSKDDFWPLMGAMVGAYAVLAVVVWLLGRLSSWIRRTARG